MMAAYVALNNVEKAWQGRAFRFLGHARPQYYPIARPYSH
jgi:hypothetical protein